MGAASVSFSQNYKSKNSVYRTFPPERANRIRSCGLDRPSLEAVNNNDKKMAKSLRPRESFGDSIHKNGADSSNALNKPTVEAEGRNVNSIRLPQEVIRKSPPFVPEQTTVKSDIAPKSIIKQTSSVNREAKPVVSNRRTSSSYNEIGHGSFLPQPFRAGRRNYSQDNSYSQARAPSKLPPSQKIITGNGTGRSMRISSEVPVENANLATSKSTPNAQINKPYQKETTLHIAPVTTNDSKQDRGDDHDDPCVTSASESKRKLVVRGLKKYKELRGACSPIWVKEFPCRSRYHPETYIYDFSEGSNVPKRNTEAMNRCSQKGGRCERCGIYTANICLKCHRCDRDCQCPPAPSSENPGAIWNDAQKFLKDVNRFPPQIPTTAPEQYPFNSGKQPPLNPIPGPPPPPTYFPPPPQPPMQNPYGYPSYPPYGYNYPPNFGAYPPPAPAYYPPNPQYPVHPPVPMAYGYPPSFYDNRPVYTSRVSVNGNSPIPPRQTQAS